MLVLITSCKEEPQKKDSASAKKSSPLSYARGFSIEHYSDYSLLRITRPWPGATTSYTYALVPITSSVELSSIRADVDAVIEVPIQKTIVTSTTHIPALELLQAENTLVGFPGCDYISSESMRTRIDAGFVKELGQNEGLNTEVILSLEPDAVIGFGIDGVNKAFETLNNAGIPVIYNGDWTEESPLAKAEWIKFFGVLYDQEKVADSIFKTIESNYIRARNLANNAKEAPTVLSGAMHKDIWYLPYGTSPEGQYLKDANVKYLWQETSGSGSLALSFESVFLKAKDAGIWINPSYYTSYKQLRQNSELYTQFEAFKNQSIYSMSMTKGATGGVLYYELGTARPDLVLMDLINICHPGLIKNYSNTFFKPIENGGDE